MHGVNNFKINKVDLSILHTKIDAVKLWSGAKKACRYDHMALSGSPLQWLVSFVQCQLCMAARSTTTPIGATNTCISTFLCIHLWIKLPARGNKD